MRTFLNGRNPVVFLCLTLGILAPFSQAIGAEKRVYETPHGWKQLVEAATREGTVVLYTSPTMDRRGKGILPRAFKKSFPGIDVKITLGSSSRMLNRILTERRAGRYIPDVLIGGTTASVMGLKPARALEPLRPNLILPEVLDESAWLMNRLWWADDAQEPYAVLMFLGYVQTVGAVNTRLANPQEFTSYWDLLKPKWKGKIVSHDIRRGGTGGFMVRFIYKHPQLGPRYLEQLYSEMDVTLTGNVRQSVDFLGKGRFAIGLFMGSNHVSKAREQGLPVSLIPAGQFKEGASVAPSSGTVGILERAPHPNAAKLFVNWLLSREGQLAYQKSSILPSLRVDISKKGLYPLDVPKPGVPYVSVGVEEYTRTGRAEIRELVSKALAKARRR